MRKLVQTEDPKFVRDTSSMALINNDKAAYLQYKARRAQGNKVSELSTEVASLKQDMVEIKSMLVTIVEGINGK
jgi:hypothetical protein|tara:strand:+ start:849 stop:1070 length:222 start_codon:yes stop_codon:yes gene_type:complete